MAGRLEGRGEEMIDADKWQGEVVKWAAYNFPRAEKHQPLLGVVEEVGELYAAYLLFSKVDETRNQKVDDAIGDIMVFLAHYCGLNGYDLMGCTDRYGRDMHKMFYPFPLHALVEAIGNLSHSHLKGEQGIRGTKHNENAQKQIGIIVGALRLFCEEQKQELTEIISDVWGEVKQRDWKKYPKDGGYKVKPRIRELQAGKPLNEEVPF